MGTNRHLAYVIENWPFLAKPSLPQKWIQLRFSFGVELNLITFYRNRKRAKENGSAWNQIAPHKCISQVSFHLLFHYLGVCFFHCIPTHRVKTTWIRYGSMRPVKIENYLSWSCVTREKMKYLLRFLSKNDTTFSYVDKFYCFSRVVS